MKSWWSLGRVGGTPVRLHWSVLLGAVIFSGFRFAPGAWLGFVLVILVHELGHMVVVKLARQRALGIDIHGLGGECQWAGNATPMQRAAIAWGGVWGQLALFALALPLSYVVGAQLGQFGLDLFYALTWGSLFIAAINLLPFPPLDGAEAWRLPPMLYRRLRREIAYRRSAKEARAPKRIEIRERLADSATRPERKAQPQAAPSQARGAQMSPELRNIFDKIAQDAREARRGRPS